MSSMVQAHNIKVQSAWSSPGGLEYVPVAHWPPHGATRSRVISIDPLEGDKRS